MSFRKRLSAGEFVVLAEMHTPKGVNISKMVMDSRRIKGRVDAVIIPDMDNGVMKMSALAGGVLMHQQGVEAIIHVYARDRNSMALQGAEALLYPTAIGSEPSEPDEDTKAPWQRVMIGHAVANAMPVAAANRIGREGGLSFYGSSFVCDQRGDIAVELGRDEEGVALASFDRDALRRYRANWGFFRDRRPELYGRLTIHEPTD